jgi:hypothetical protein
VRRTIDAQIRPITQRLFSLYVNIAKTLAMRRQRDLVERPGSNVSGPAASISVRSGSCYDSRRGGINANLSLGLLHCPPLFHRFCTAIDAGPIRQEGVEQRGDHVMGFSHDLATHHFRLLKSDSEIVVNANDQKDTASVDQIRRHLRRITSMFSNGLSTPQ